MRMRPLVAASILSVSMLNACGPASDSGSTDAKATPPPATTPTTVVGAQDFSKPFTLTVTGATVTVPAGAMAEGSTIAAAPATAPAEFATAAEVSVASGALSVTATDKAGAATPQALLPLTLAIDLTVAALALGAVEKIPTNLCVFAKSTAGELLVWRNAALAVDATGKSGTLASKWFGTFQLYYCGTVAVPGSLEVVKAGNVAEAAKAALPEVPKTPSAATGLVSAGTCNIPTVGICQNYWGKKFATAEVIGSFVASCEQLGSTLKQEPCASEGAIGACVYYKGTDLETISTYYSTAAAPANAEDVAAGCAKEKGEWFAAAAGYTPTAADAQIEYVAPQASTSPTTPDPVTTPSAGPGVCDKAASPGFECIDYKGSYFANIASTLESSCPVMGGVWITGGTCPTGVVATCTNGGNLGADYTSVKNYYVGFSPAMQEACEADTQNNGVWQAN